MSDIPLARTMVSQLRTKLQTAEFVRRKGESEKAVEYLEACAALAASIESACHRAIRNTEKGGE